MYGGTPPKTLKNKFASFEHPAISSSTKVISGHDSLIIIISEAEQAHLDQYLINLPTSYYQLQLTSIHQNLSH